MKTLAFRATRDYEKGEVISIRLDELIEVERGPKESRVVLWEGIDFEVDKQTRSIRLLRKLP